VSDLIRLPNGDGLAAETIDGVRVSMDGSGIYVEKGKYSLFCRCKDKAEAIAERDRIIGLVDVARREAALDPRHFKTNAGPVWVMGDNAWTGQLVTLNQASGTLRVYKKAEGSILPESSDPEAYAEMISDPGAPTVEDFKILKQRNREKLAFNWLRQEIAYEEVGANSLGQMDDLNIAMLDVKDALKADPTPIRLKRSMRGEDTLYEVYPNDKGVPKYRIVEGGGE
jgi:hypothetical protein